MKIVLKDHDNESVLHHFVKSQARVLRDEAEKEGIHLDRVSLMEGDSYSTHTLATLWLTKSIDGNNAKELRAAVLKIRQWICIKLVDESLEGKVLFVIPIFWLISIKLRF